MRRPKQLNYIQKKLVDIKYFIYGSNKYLEKYGMPKTIADLNKHKFISFGKGAPSPLGDTFQQKKDKKQYRGGKLQFRHGARMFTCPSTLNVVPEVGDFYLFPNYLMHTVFPFKGTDEERRSISFNAFIDESIFNVHGRQ